MFTSIYNVTIMIDSIGLDIQLKTYFLIDFPHLNLIDAKLFAKELDW